MAGDSGSGDGLYAARQTKLLEMEEMRDRQEAEYRASIVRIAKTLEEILLLLKSREIREEFK